MATAIVVATVAAAVPLAVGQSEVRVSARSFTMAEGGLWLVVNG
jgi:hypothetical protein